MATGVKAQLIKGDPEAIRKRLAALERKLKKVPNIAVGLPRNSMPYPDGTSVIMVAFWNEFGTEHIHERAFLRTAAHNNRDKWLKLTRDIFRKAIEKDKDPADYFNLIGEVMQSDVQKSIDSGAWEPNQGAYAAWKTAKGKTKPLILTGHLRGSIRYVVRENTRDTQ